MRLQRLRIVVEYQNRNTHRFELVGGLAQCIVLPTGNNHEIRASRNRAFDGTARGFCVAHIRKIGQLWERLSIGRPLLVPPVGPRSTRQADDLVDGAVPVMCVRALACSTRRCVRTGRVMPPVLLPADGSGVTGRRAGAVVRLFRLASGERRGMADKISGAQIQRYLRRLRRRLIGAADGYLNATGLPCSGPLSVCRRSTKGTPVSGLRGVRRVVE